MRSAHNIDAADRAHFAAEAGIEDALYEISQHSAGYEASGRTNNFSSEIQWKNDWEVSSTPQSCSWTNMEFCGAINERQKLIINGYKDIASSTTTNNQIGETVESIDRLEITNFNISFKIPSEIVTNNSAAFGGGLIIDNDGDAWQGRTNGINEDGEGDEGSCNGEVSRDADCDGREDEDSEKDPVIYWRITNNEGLELRPKPGCMADGDGSEICEKDFDDVDHLVVLTGTEKGIDQDGKEVASINSFLSSIPTTNNSKLTFEFSIVAPMEQVYEAELKKIEIPYFEYGVDYSPTTEAIPSPYFTINSNGIYNDFQQSIKATIEPQNSLPLFDFTIIQQQ